MNNLRYSDQYAAGSLGAWALAVAKLAVENVEDVRYQLPCNWRDCSMGFVNKLQKTDYLDELYRGTDKRYNVNLIWTGVGSTDMALAIGSFDDDNQVLVPVFDGMDVKVLASNLITALVTNWQDASELYLDDVDIVCWFINR